MASGKNGISRIAERVEIDSLREDRRRAGRKKTDCDDFAKSHSGNSPQVERSAGRSLLPIRSLEVRNSEPATVGFLERATPSGCTLLDPCERWVSAPGRIALQRLNLVAENHKM